MKPSNSPTAACSRSRQRGFTLLEVLVAFLLLSMTLGVILQIFSSGLRNTAAAGHYTHAAILADSKLAMLGGEFPLVEGENSGEEGNYSWRMTIEPYHDDNELNNLTAGRYPLYAITFSVQWQQGADTPELLFDTYRVGMPDGL